MKAPPERSRPRSRTQPDLDPPLLRSLSPSPASPLSAHHFKSKSLHHLSKLTSESCNYSLNRSELVESAHNRSVVVHSETKEKNERILSAYERKQRRDLYSALWREEAFKKAKRAANNAATLEAEFNQLRTEGHRKPCMRAILNGVDSTVEKTAKLLPFQRLMAPAKTEQSSKATEIDNALSISTQTNIEGWNRAEIQDQLISMLSRARERLQKEITMFEDKLLHKHEGHSTNKENENALMSPTSTSKKLAPTGVDNVNNLFTRDDTSEEEQTEILKNLHTHLVVCKKLEQQVLDMLDTTFTLIDAYGNNEVHSSFQDDPIPIHAYAGQKIKPGQRISRFERFLQAERVRTKPVAINQGDITSSNDSQSRRGLDTSYNTINTTASSEMTAGSANSSFTFASCPSFQTIEFSNRNLLRPLAVPLLVQETGHVPASTERPVIAQAFHSPLQNKGASTPEPTAFDLASDSTCHNVAPSQPKRLSVHDRHVLHQSPSRVLNYGTMIGASSWNTPNAQITPTAATSAMHASVARPAEESPKQLHERNPSVAVSPKAVNYSFSNDRFATISGHLRVISREGNDIPIAHTVFQGNNIASLSPQKQHLHQPLCQLQGGPPTSAIQPELLEKRVACMPLETRLHQPLQQLHNPSATAQSMLPLFDKLSLYEHELESAHAEIYKLRHLSAAQLSESSSHLNALCIAIAQHGMKAEKFHTSYYETRQDDAHQSSHAAHPNRSRAKRVLQTLTGQSATRWLSLTTDNKYIQWTSSRASNAHRSCMSVAELSLRVGLECPVASRLNLKRSSINELDRCLSFVSLTRSLDVLFESQWQVAIWEHIIIMRDRESFGISHVSVSE